MWSPGASDDVDGVSPLAPPKSQAKCLSARPSAGVGGFYGGPKASLTRLDNCPHASAHVANTSQFVIAANGELQAGTGLCVVAKPMFGCQLWSKPLPGSKVAVLVINLGEGTEDFSLPLADVPGLSCGGSCSLRDVWQKKDADPQATAVHMVLRQHESSFLILGPDRKSVV
jgi:hypothetical protein